jgi:hypothetical protein
MLIVGVSAVHPGLDLADITITQLTCRRHVLCSTRNIFKGVDQFTACYGDFEIIITVKLVTSARIPCGMTTLVQAIHLYDRLYVPSVFHVYSVTGGFIGVECFGVVGFTGIGKYKTQTQDNQQFIHLLQQVFKRQM